MLVIAVHMDQTITWLPADDFPVLSLNRTGGGGGGGGRECASVDSTFQVATVP